MTSGQPDPMIAALAGDARLEALSRAGLEGTDLASLVGQVETSDLPGDIVIIEHDRPGGLELIEAYGLRRPEIALLVIGDDLPVRAVRAMLRFAASDVVPSDVSAEEVLGALQRLRDGQAASDASGEGSSGGASCWALRGAVGGAGATTLAIEMAFALARRAPDESVCLVDLNLADAMAPAFLDGEAKLDLAAVCASPERLDATLLRVYTWAHEKGVALIAAPRNGDADASATRDGILCLLDVACANFHRVIVDLPRHKLAWTDPIQTAVDEMIVVSELTVPSLHAAADLCREIDLVRETGPSQLVLNRMFAKRRQRHSFPLQKAERAIKRSIDHTIRSDWDAARMAVNLGMPVAQAKAKSPLVKDVLAMVEALAGEGARNARKAA